MVNAQDITVAWRPGAAALREPTAFAYLVAGLLEEAALLIGTERRTELRVIVYPSVATFREESHAPQWAEGLYDGAVRLPAEPREDFGVRLSTLRHELMHAQLHSGAGCIPIWFNEGVASLFEDRPPRRAWVRMLRQRRLLDLRSLEVPTIDQVPADDVDLAYGQSLAMVLLLRDRGGENATREVVRDLEALKSSPEAALRFWSSLPRDIVRTDLLDFLALRIFKVPQGRDLDAIFDGAVCCYGSGTISDFGCRGGALKPGKHVWFDRSREPSAMCESD